MKEEWRDIDGYIGYYQVSNLGRVRGVDRVTENKKTFRSILTTTNLQRIIRCN